MKTTTLQTTPGTKIAWYDDVWYAADDGYGHEASTAESDAVTQQPSPHVLCVTGFDFMQPPSRHSSQSAPSSPPRADDSSFFSQSNRANTRSSGSSGTMARTAVAASVLFSLMLPTHQFLMVGPTPDYEHNNSQHYTNYSVDTISDTDENQYVFPIIPILRFT